MKSGIHPTYHASAAITCACGASYTIGSTQEEINTEICAKCHPFYTGTQRIVDTAQRVEKFQAKLEKRKVASQGRKTKKEKNAERAAKKIEKQQAVESADA